MHKQKHNFFYKGKLYSGHIISSTDIEPHFHWFLFDDVELISSISDSIAFTTRNGSLVPVHTYSKHRELVEIIREIIEKNIAGISG